MGHRMDWKKGRFDQRYEVAQIEEALRGYQGSQIEDSVDYWRFDRANSQMDDVYNEGYGTGLVFHPSVNVPALHVTHNEGGRTGQLEGFYFNDALYVTTSYDMFTRTGLTNADVHHEKYLKDRMIYDNLVFRVDSIQILGQVDRRDTVVSIEATQVKPDEMSNDPQFISYAVQPYPDN